MTITYQKPSICDCGFPVLKETIPLGTKYTVLAGPENGFKFTCGGCGKTLTISAMFVTRKGGGAPGYLPVEIFEPQQKV